MDAEPGARLTCHLLLRIFQTIQAAPGHPPDSKQGLCIRSSSDRHLLQAAHQSVTDGAVVAVLKAMLMLGKHLFDGRSSVYGITTLSVWGPAYDVRI